MAAQILKLIERFGALVLIAWLAITLYEELGLWHADMAGIYMAARFYAQGAYDLIYPGTSFIISETPPEWKPTLVQMGIDSHYTYPFIYPPLWAALLSPLTNLMSPETFLNATLIGQFALYLWSIRLAWEITGRPMSFGLWALISTALGTQLAAPFFALSLNQPQIALTALGLYAVFALQRGRQVRGGLALALGAAVKLTPAIFVIMLVATRQWRALWAFAAGLAVCVLASLLLGGLDLNLLFAERIRAVSGLLNSARITTNLAPVYAWLFAVPLDPIRVFADGAGYLAPLPLLIRLLTLASAALLIGASLWFSRTQATNPRLTTLFIALSIIAALCGPFGWVHYFLAVTLVLPALFIRPRLLIIVALTLPPLTLTYTLAVLPTPAQVAAVLAYLVLLAVFVLQKPVSAP